MKFGFEIWGAKISRMSNRLPGFAPGQAPATVLGLERL